MSNLSISEIQKRDGRIEILLNKLAKNDKFKTSRGNIKAGLLYWYQRNKSVIIFDPCEKKQFVNAQKALNNATSADKFQVVNKTDSSKTAALSDLVKTPEFGGKVAGSSLSAESRAMEAMKLAIELAIKENKGSITVKVKNTNVSDVVGVEKTSGTPKSDFHLFNSEGKPVIWISHKDGRSAKDFQQWGGISERTEPEINRCAETQKFIDDLRKSYPNGVGTEPGQPKSLYRKIKDSEIKFMAMYGNNFSTGNLGIQNVSVLLQGPPGLKKSGRSYEFTANHIHYNGETVDNTEFEPVFMAIYKGDRSDAGIKGTRIVISPIGGRKAVEFPALP